MDKSIRVYILALVNILALLTFNSAVVEAAIFNVSNPTEFQNALNSAAANGEDDTINVLASGTFNLSSTLNYNSIENNSLVIEGSGGVALLNGQNSVQILNVNTGGIDAHITVRNLNFQDGNSATSGGGLRINTTSGNIAVESCQFNSNSAGGSNGGVYVNSSSGSITLTDNTFTNNSSGGSTGGLYVNTSTGPITLTNNTFSGNSAGGSNGGVYVNSSSGSITLTDNTLTNNSAGGSNGGAYLNTSNGSITLTGNTFTNNSADSSGGIYANSFSGSLALTNNTFTNNSASSGSYGGIYANSFSGSITLTSNMFSGNSATGDVGGAYANSLDGSVTLTNNRFASNSAGGSYGGASASSAGGWVAFINNTFFNNSASSLAGGAFIRTDTNTTTANIYNNIFWNNTAGAGGNDGDDLYVNSDGGSPVNLYNNDLGVNANFVTGQSEDLNITDTNNYAQSSNIQVDPLLTADLHLQGSSPCINAGTNSVPAPGLPPTDFEGDSRVIGGTPDIGADEYRIAVAESVTVPTMTEWGMIILIILIGITSIYSLKRIKRAA